MALDAEDLVWVRNQIGDGDPPSDADLNERYDVLGDRVGVVKEVLDRRLANLLADPATFAISGEYSQSTGDNIRAIQKKLEELGGSTGESGLKIFDPCVKSLR